MTDRRPKGSEAAVPDDIRALADERALARAGKEWAVADGLRARIEAAGWRVVDRGFSYRLEPAHRPTVEVAGLVRYGRSADVPSRLDLPPIGTATVVVVATDWPDDVARTLASLATTTPDGASVVVVADGPTPEQDAALAAGSLPVVGGGPIEVVRTIERLGTGAAWTSGVRRAGGAVVVILDPSVEATGDVVSPLIEALSDPSVGVAGGWGLVTEDLRRFREAPAGDVDAVEGYLLAFRRADAVERGPIDERFRYYRNLDIWWSLVLRDEGEGRPARRAVAVDVPAVRHEHRGWTSLPDAERDRLSKRNFYRVLDRFGGRLDLLTRRLSDGT